MVDFSRPAFISLENSHSFIIRASDEFFAGRGVVDIKHSEDMVLVNHLYSVKFSHVIGVEVTVLISDSEIEGFLGVPASGGAFVSHGDRFQGIISSQIVEVNGPIIAGGEDDVVFDVVEFDFNEAVCDVLEGLQRSVALVVPNGDDSA